MAMKRVALPAVVAFIVACTKSGTPASAPPAPPAPAANLETIRQLLAQPEDKIDFATAKLTIDKMIDPTIDIEAASKQLDMLSADIWRNLPPQPSSRIKVEAMRAHLYQPGPWNGHRPFAYDLNDPLGRDMRSKLLPTYLATRKGNCISMPMLFIVLGQKLGIDVTASTAPDHVFVKFRDDDGQVFNLETTSGAGITSDGWIQQQSHVRPEAIASGIYMQRLTKKETVVVMATTLMEHYNRVDQQEARIALAMLGLEHSPKDVNCMLHVSAGHGHMLEKEFLTRYRRPRDIPIAERPRFEQLDEGIRLWRQKAEALGWREPDDAYKAEYKDRIEAAKAGHP